MASLLLRVCSGFDEPVRTQIVRLLVGFKTFLVAEATDPGGATEHARYCYSVWLRHLCLLAEAGAALPLRDVVELGPGASLGTGLAALLSGSRAFHAYDVVRGVSPALNGRVYDELVALFHDTEPIPGEFRGLYPSVPSLDFPRFLDRTRLERALRPDRVEAIRALVDREGGIVPAYNVELGYHAPLPDLMLRPAASTDLVLTQSVLEYVPDPGRTLAELARLLRPGGWMSHQVDFSALETSAVWNGHWSYSDLTWRVICGKRAFNLNRMTLSSCVDAMHASGVEVVDVRPVYDDTGLKRHQLNPRYARLSDEDLRTRSAHIVGRKPT